MIRDKLAVVLIVLLALSMTAACTPKTDGRTGTGKTSSQDTKDKSQEPEADGEMSGDSQEPGTAGEASGDSQTAGSQKEGTEAGEAKPYTSAEKSEEDILEETVGEYLERMTVEEKAAQLFIILPESLMKDAGTVTAAGEATKKAVGKIPVGGFIYLDGNLKSAEQVKKMLANVQTYSMDRTGLPMFLCVDEEGGAVARIAGSGRFDVPRMEDMSKIGAGGDAGEARETGEKIGDYLNEMGFNVDFAPVADVLTNPDNQVVKRRAFSSDPETAAEMALAVAGGLEDQGVCAVYKHFPGHGSTAADTHEGYAYTDKDIEELKSQELVPFQRAIDSGAKVIMVGHISLPKVTGEDTPASMSPEIITDLLRTQMDYDGLVVTDALNMGAVTEQYTSAQAAVQTILAGSDLVLMPDDFDGAYQGVLDAVKDGTISKERLDESLRRILRMKISMMEE